MKEEDLPALCGEIRDFLVKNVSKTGGHLASNLGAVELTVAIHRLFDTSRDRLVFDVGHQSYVHKILTGRREAFSTLRCLGGIAGFPKPDESGHDAFIAGHASAAVSAALGMARARTLSGDNYRVIAVVGDGALTGGLAYEGLCDAGASREPLIVVLNDNGMSIAKNVGGMAKYLARARMKPGYLAFKNFYRGLTKRTAAGKRFYRFTHRIKQNIKKAVLQCSFFEDIGFSYLGPVDGHNLKKLTQALAIARDMKEPVLVHVITQKGRGYPSAEQDPDAFHGVPPFDAEAGVIPFEGGSFSSVFGAEMIRLAEKDGKVIAVTAAMRDGTGLADFAGAFPRRFFDVGIAEEHAAVMAAGAAKQGMKPVVALYSTFLQRAYDMLLQEIGIGKVHVVLAVDRAGIVGRDGETHQGIFDVPYLSGVPGMTIYSPSSYAELRDMLALAVEKLDGPAAVRYPRGGEGRYRAGGTEPWKLLRAGRDLTIAAYGITVNAALDAADALAQKGVSAQVLKLGRLKPLPADAVAACAAQTGRLLVVEECCSRGSVGEALAAELAQRGEAPGKLTLLNLGDSYVPHGSVEELRAARGVDAAGIAAAALKMAGDARAEDAV